MSQNSITESPSITRWLDFVRYYIVCNRKKYMMEAIRKWLRLIMTRSLTSMEMVFNPQFSCIWKLEIMFSMFDFPRYQVWNVAYARKTKFVNKKLFWQRRKLSFFFLPGPRTVVKLISILSVIYLFIYLFVYLFVY